MISGHIPNWKKNQVLIISFYVKNKHKKNKKDKPTANELLAFGGRWERDST